MLEKCLLNVLELIWNQRLGHKKTKLNVCHHMLTSSTQLQNSSFHVVERTRTSTKCQKMKNARAKRAKILFFNVKYANLWGFCCRRHRGCLSSLIGSLSKDDVDDSENESSENVTSGFCKVIKLAKCVLVILELNWNKRFSGKNAKLNICDLSSLVCSRHPHNCKTCHFTSWKELERLRGEEKRKMRVQSLQNDCFTLSNM